MVMLELFTEKPPFASTVTDPGVVIDIFHGRKPERPKFDDIKGKDFSDSIWECIQRCWSKAPADRLHAVEICKILKKEQKIPQAFVGVLTIVSKFQWSISTNGSSHTFITTQNRLRFDVDFDEDEEDNWAERDLVEDSYKFEESRKSIVSSPSIQS